MTDTVVWMRADEESEAYLAPADTPVDDHGKLKGSIMTARYQTDFVTRAGRPDPVHGHLAQADGGRLGGADPVPGARRRQPCADGLEHAAPGGAAPGLRAADRRHGAGAGGGDQLGHGRQGRRRTARSPTSTPTEIIIDHNHIYKLRKYVGLERADLPEPEAGVQVGQKVKKGEILADGASTYKGELSLGRNVLVAFMAWDGYNFEDAIIISEKLVRDDVYTSIHIEEFEIEIRETKLGREEFTRDIPNVSEKALRNLDDNGVVQIGTYVKPGDILVGKVAPKSKSELTPEEKLLHAIFGRAGEDVKNDSLEVPSGVEGIVINTQRFSRRMSLSEEERKAFEKELKDTEAAENVRIADEYKQMIKALEEAIGGPVPDPSTGKPLGRAKDPKDLVDESRSVQARGARHPQPGRRRQGARGRAPARAA